MTEGGINEGKGDVYIISNTMLKAKERRRQEQGPKIQARRDPEETGKKTEVDLLQL